MAYKLNKANTENFIEDDYELAVYRTGYPIDFELMSRFDIGDIEHEDIKNLMSMDEEYIIQDDAFEKLSNYMSKRGKVITKPETFIDRMYLANSFINTLPAGIKGGDSILMLGYSGLGKTAYSVQIGGEIVKPYIGQDTNDGKAKAEFIYYGTETNPTYRYRLKQLLGIKDDDIYNKTVTSYSTNDETSIAHFTNMIIKKSEDKLARINEYVVESMTTEGNIKKYIAPTVVVVDSLSAMVSGKLFEKIYGEFAKGKEGNKESDMMRDLQVKATMFQTRIVSNAAKKANIIIVYIGHIGQDQGISIGYTNITVQTGLNKNSYEKIKGVPASATYQMSFTLNFNKMNSKSADLNEYFNVENIQFVANGSIDKNRSGGVNKGKYAPFVFNTEGEFDRTFSLIYFYYNVLGLFDFGSKNKIPGIKNVTGAPLAITRGKVFMEKIYHNPDALVTIRVAIFLNAYICKLFEDDAYTKAKQVANDLF